ncbi:MAG: CocE/NonD family hydrolase C-terminal non-catalytic domain-containing protein, partial [Xanthobacteraceae bacterium]
EEQLGANRRDWHADCLANPLVTDPFWTSRMPDFSKVTVPFLSLANWGGQGLHLRGNIEGYLEAASKQKWLEIHGREHWIEYYTDYGIDLQKRFFAHFLKGEKAAWDNQPKVQILVRHLGDRYVERHEADWPLRRTQWTKLHLDGNDLSLAAQPVAKKSTQTYRGFSDGVTFLTQPLPQDTEITGPIAATLFVSSSTEDADLFLVVRAFSPDFKEFTFQGHIDPHTPLAQGWLRASHRKLDAKRTLPYRPYHTHDEIQKLTPRTIYELDVEVWPTCVVVPKGYRIALSVRGRDYAYGGEPVPTYQGAFTGVAAFRHDEPLDRPPAVFDGDVTLHLGGEHDSYVLFPVIPA